MTATPIHCNGSTPSPNIITETSMPEGSSDAASTVEMPAGRFGDPNPKSRTGNNIPKNPTTNP